MEEKLEDKNIELIYNLEALLFVSGKPLVFEDVRKYFGISKSELLNAVDILKREKENSGINIKVFDNMDIQAVTNPKCGEAVLKYFNPDAKPKKLSKAALETIAIIAYNQPITKGEIELIRGVNVEKVLTSLEERSFIKIVGKKMAIGSPNLYSVTEEFKNYIGVKEIEELPDYNEVKNLAKSNEN